MYMLFPNARLDSSVSCNLFLHKTRALKRFVWIINRVASTMQKYHSIIKNGELMCWFSWNKSARMNIAWANVRCAKVKFTFFCVSWKLYIDELP